MKTVTDTYAPPARRGIAAQALANGRFARRIVRARKGKGSYSRKGRPQ